MNTSCCHFCMGFSGGRRQSDGSVRENNSSDTTQWRWVRTTCADYRCERLILSLKEKGKRSYDPMSCQREREKKWIAPSPTLWKTPPDESKLDELVPGEVCGQNESRLPVYMLFLHCWGTLQTLCLYNPVPANPHCSRTLGHPTP